MTRRHLAVLALAAVLAVLAAFYSTSVREPQGSAAGGDGMLIPDLKERLNDVSEVRITAAGDEDAVTLVRGESQWSVQQKSGYAADTGKIRQLLLGLADARLREAKTSNPENYHFLALQDISSPDAQGVQVALAGVESVPVIVGKTAADVGEATYARLAGASKSWLVSGRIDVATEPLDWLNRDVVDLPASRIQSVSVRHPDGETLRLSRPERSTPRFTVESIPQGRELSSPTAAEPMGSVLQNLQFDDVLPASEAAMEAPVVTQYRLFNGLVISVESVLQEDGKPLISMRVAFDEALASEFLPPVEDFETVAGEVAAETSSESAPSFTAAMEEAEALNARLSPWAFRIPTYKNQQMTRRMDALLKAPAADAE